MLNKDEMDLLDSFILRSIVAKQEAVNTSDKALGEQAFGWHSSPIMKVQGIKGKGGKKPQQLRLADVLNICEAIGLPFAATVSEALNDVRSIKKAKKSDTSEG